VRAVSFWWIENGVPSAPPAFATSTTCSRSIRKQAARIEALRGAGSSLFGATRLHGAINVVTPTTAEPGRLYVEGGPDDYGAVRLSASTMVDEQLLRFDGIGVLRTVRDATGHDEQKVTLTQLGPVGGSTHTTFEGRT
jgi:outer membrane cobalamin receptor